MVVIDPEVKVRAILYYPLSNGRNMQEVMRLLVAMQHSDQYKIAMPANWQPGDDVIVPPPGSCGVAKAVRCLFLFLALALYVLAVSSLVCLDVLESPFAVTDGVELLP